MGWVMALNSDTAMGLGGKLLALFILVLIASILVQLWLEYIDDGDTDNPFWLVYFISVHIFQCTYLKGAYGISHCYTDIEGGHGNGFASCLFTCVLVLFLPLALMWLLLALVYGWGVFISIAGFCLLSVALKNTRTLYKRFNKHEVTKEAHTDKGVKEAHTFNSDRCGNRYPKSGAE